MTGNEILSKLNREQKDAVLTTEGPVLILAGAGSGKTRVIVHRIAYLIEECDVPPFCILAITFTNKAADEMRERVDSMIGYGADAIWVMTFHAFCVRVLRRHAELVGLTRWFSIYDTDDQVSLMKEILHRRNLDPKQFKEKAVLAAISAAKDELIAPEEYRRQNAGNYRLELIGELYSDYQNALKENNAADFDDLINETVRLFRENPDVLSIYQERFMYLHVDEYQDTNTAQFELIRLLASKYGNLCVVGDDDQSIYKFRGANIGNILNFEKHFPGAKVVRLEQNYRSTQRILDAANEVIKNNAGRKSKRLWTDNGTGTKVRVRRFANGFEEAEFIVGEIARSVRMRDCSYSDCAVLYRTNAQSRLFEEKMLMANIPYRIVGGTNFYSRREIKDLLAYLKTIDNAVDAVAVRRIINVPKRGIGAATIDKIGAVAQDLGIPFYDALGSEAGLAAAGRSAARVKAFLDFIGELRDEAEEKSVSGVLQAVIEKTGYVEELKREDTDEARGRIENIDELISKAVTYEEGAENPSLSDFLGEVALVADIDSVEASEDRVLLMTLHSAKGLEFDRVYIAGMEEGLFPSYLSISSEDEGEIEEERRLAYVGITRAKRELTLTWARERMVRGDIVMNGMSRFITEIPREFVDLGEPPARRQELPRSLGGGARLFGDDEGSYKNSSIAKMREAFRGGPYGTKRPDARARSGEGAARDIGNAGGGALGYGVGDRVEHARFGEGIVKEIVKGGRDYEVTVDFDGTVKKMFASFAKLRKI